MILGAAAENNYSLIYTIVSGVPLGIGVLIIYPLSQKFTIRKTTMAFGVWPFWVVLWGLPAVQISRLRWQQTSCSIWEPYLWSTF